MKLQMLKENKNKFSKILTSDVKYLGNIFKKSGHELRVVGGAVRDAVLGKHPKDIDLVTNATPQQMLDIAKDNNLKIIETGLQHGTLTFVINDENYEVTTLRIDKKTFGRRAEVEWTDSFKEDAERRDLTYNAMSVDMNGKLYDYFNGVNDLKKGKSKFIGNTEKRITEDYLRILRYFRFSGRQNNIHRDRRTLRVIKDNVYGLKNISGERIWMEMKKILTGNNVKDILNQMCYAEVLQELQLKCNTININNADRLSNLTYYPITILSSLIDNEFDFMKIANRYKFTVDERKLGLFINSRKNDKNLNLGKIKSSVIINGESKFYYEQLTLFLNDNKLYNEIKNLTIPSFPVSGKDLLDLGYKPGPELGKKLKELKQIWIDKNFKINKKDLLDIIREKN